MNLFGHEILLVILLLRKWMGLVHNPCKSSLLLPSPKWACDTPCKNGANEEDHADELAQPQCCLALTMNATTDSRISVISFITKPNRGFQWIGRSRRNGIQRDGQSNAAHDRSFFLCEKCVAMTSDTHNAEKLNTQEGFRHSSRQDLALSSRNCRFCFWLWSQLHRKWETKSLGILYLSSTGKERLNQVIKVKEDGQRYIATVSIRNGLDVGDLVHGEVRYPTAPLAVEELSAMASFEVVGKNPAILIISLIKSEEVLTNK